MYCCKCGEEISDKAKFCPKCGAKQEKNVIPSNLENLVDQRENEAEDLDKKLADTVENSPEVVKKYNFAVIVTCTLLMVLLLTNWIEIDYWFWDVNIKPLNLIFQMINSTGAAEICERGTQESAMLISLGICGYIPLLFIALGIINAINFKNDKAKTFTIIACVCEMILVALYLVLAQSLKEDAGIFFATSWTYITLAISVVGIISVKKDKFHR